MEHIGFVTIRKIKLSIISTHVEENHLKKRNSKHRLLGAAAGAVKGLFVAVLVCVPLSGKDVMKLVEEGALSAGHARALLGLDDDKLISDIAAEIVEKQLSVRQTEQLVKDLSKKKEEAKAVPATVSAPAVVEETEDLSDDLELVAVIAAAIAASEGAESTDGFVVRTIRRRYI